MSLLTIWRQLRRLAWIRRPSFKMLKLDGISSTHSYYIYLQHLFFYFVSNFMAVLIHFPCLLAVFLYILCPTCTCYFLQLKPDL